MKPSARRVFSTQVRLASGRSFNLAFPPLSLLLSLVAPVPGSLSSPSVAAIPGETPGSAVATGAVSGWRQECTAGFEHTLVGTGESLGLIVMFIEFSGCSNLQDPYVVLGNTPFGGAEYDVDYRIPSDTIYLNDADGTEGWGFTVIDDDIEEEDEGAYVFFSVLSPGVTADAAADTAVITIRDDDGPERPGFPRNLDADPDDRRVTLSWLPPSDTGSAAITGYEYRYAEAGDDYPETWNTVAGGAGARSAIVSPLTNGTEYKFEVRAVNDHGGGDAAEALATPAVPSSLAIGDVTVGEGDGTAVLEVKLTPKSAETVTVEYATADETATAGDDYVTEDGTLTFFQGDTLQEIYVSITDDTDDDDGETFTVTLGNPDNATLGDGTAQITITDDDELPGAPRDLEADPDDGEVTLSWSPPASSGSADIDEYEYRYAESSDAFPDGWTDVPGGAAATEVTVGSLTNDTRHRFQLRAVNEVGGGDPAETEATPTPPPTLSIGDLSVAEGIGTAVLEVTLTPASAETVTVNYATADASATDGEDYIATDGELTFTAGVTSQEIRVSITDDADDENAETLTVTLSDAVNAVIGDGTAELTIEDDDLTPGPPQDLEADPDDAMVTLSWSPPSIVGSSDVTGYEHRHAENSDAYADMWAQVSGGAGATEVTVGSLRNGTVYKFQVRAVNDVGGGEPAETTATPAVPPSLSIGDVSIAEDGETAVLEVSLTPASAETVTVGYGTGDATAVAGEDYVTKDGTLTFLAGEVSMQVSVSIADDTDDEDDETFNVTLSDPVNAVIGDGTGMVTIEDDDVVPGAPEDLSADPDNARVTLSWTPPSTVGSAEITGYEYRYAKDPDAFPDTWTGVSGGAGADEVTVRSLVNGTLHRFAVRAVNEVGGGEAAETTATPAVPPVLTISDVEVGEGDGTAVVEVTLTSIGVEQVTVAYATRNATATAGEDYTATNGTLTFEPGDTSREISVLITEDPADEDDETFAVNLSNPVNATIGDATGQVTIGDDDQAPGPPRDLSAEAGDSTVQLSWSPPADSGTAAITEYEYRYAAGSAAYPRTWTDISGGVAAREITVGSLNNNVVHRFQVRAVSNAGSGEPAQTSATPVPPPSLTIGDVTVDEGGGPASVQVTMSRPSDSTVTVKYQTADGTATAGQDYTPATGTLTFTPGMTSLDIDVAIADDAVEEATETLTANLSDARNAVIRDATGRLQILDNDERPGPPQGLVADPDDGRVKLSWTPPANSGSTPVTEYEYRYVAGPNAYPNTWVDVPGGAGARELTIRGLTNGIRYRFQVRAVNATGGGEPAEVTATPATVPSLAISDGSADERDSYAELTVTLGPPSTEVVTVEYATVSGSATAGEDFDTTDGTLTFTAGVTRQRIRIGIIADRIEERTESFTVVLRNATNADLTDSIGRVLIDDDDEPPGPPRGLVAEPGDGEVTLRWFPPADSGSAPVTRYEYRYAPDAEAHTGSWTRVSGGAVARQVVVGNLTNGTRYRFQVRAVNRVGAGPPAEVTAVPETTHLLAINDVEVGEGDATAVLQVTLSPASDQSVTVTFATANGTATMGEDYVSASGTLTFPPNVTARGITLDIVDDHADEGDETFFVTLSDATHAVISDVTGQVTILDDDEPAVNPPGRPLQLQAEPGDGEVTLSWSPPTSDGGAAITGYEYRFVAGSAAFTDLWGRVPGGSGARDIVVGELSNGTRYRFQVRALNPAGPGPPGEAEATPRGGGAVSVSPQRLEMQEGGSAEYSIVLLEEPLGSVTVRMTADLSGTGLSVHPPQLLFTQANWDVARTVTVRAAVDPDEDDEPEIALTHEASGGGYDTVAVPTVLVDVRDAGLPVLSGEGGRATEGQSAQLVFSVRLSAASTEPVTVEFATADETAVAGEDYQERSGQLVFSPGTTHLTVSVPLVNDQRHEQVEAFRLELFNPVNAKFPVVLERLAVTGTIVDDDELIRVSFDAGAYEVNEGGEIEVVVELSRDPGRLVEVPISVSRGRGVAATEFSVPRTVSFDSGETRSVVMFGANEDEVDEVDETVVLRLGPLFPEELVPGNPAVAEVMIIDDDERGLQVSTEVLELQEGGSVDYSVWLTSEPTGNVTVAVGGDLAGSDVAVSPTVLAFTPLNWNERQTVTVGAAEDGDAVEDQDVVLRHRISGADYTGVETRTVVVTVIEDDTPVLVVADARASEEEGQLIFEATLDIPSSREVTAEYTTVNGTATEGMDFLLRQGVLVFAPLETGTRLIVPLVDDEVDEATEYFTLQLGSIVNAEPAGGAVSATGAILDDDVPTVRISPDGSSVPEGGEARFRLVREGDLSVSVSVPVVVTETGEFLAGTPPDSVEFTVGEAEAILVLATVDDELDEQDGTIEATIARSDDYEIEGSATARLIVTDNDAVPAIVIAGAQASEREGEIVFPVTLRGASAYEVTVNWVTADGTARAGADYTAGAGRVLFAPGETSGLVRVAVLDDLLPEPAETFTVSLSGPTNAGVGVASATGTITDDDEAMIKGWLSRFGRTVASQVVEGITGRLMGAGGGAHLNTAGAASDPGGGRKPALRDLMDGSGFRVSRRSEGQAGALSGGLWSAWGQGVRTAFEGGEHDLAVDGRVLTGLAGVDYEVGRYLAGIAVGRSSGSGTLTMLASETERERSEDVESALTGVYPYLRVNLHEQVFAWGMLGHGRGGMTFPSVGQPSETDIRLNMGAFGARGVLLDPGRRKIGLALKSDVFVVGMSTEALVGTMAVTAGAHRMRLLLEASERREVGADGVLVSTAEMGLRRDGGDAEVGTGVEVGAGSRYVNESHGISAEGTIRWLMVHHAIGFSEWGVGGSVLYEPGGAGRGLSVRIGSSWGAAAGRAAEMWSPRGATKMATAGRHGTGVDDRAARAFAAQVRYALSPSGRRWSVAPYAEIGVVGAVRAATSRLGWRVTLMESFRVSLETGLGGGWEDEGRSIALRGSLLR